MIVELTIGAAALPATMADMRSWLDHNHCTPVRFETKSTAPGVIRIRIEFGDSADAVANAAAFQHVFDTVVPESALQPA